MSAISVPVLGRYRHAWHGRGEMRLHASAPRQIEPGAYLARVAEWYLPGLLLRSLPLSLRRQDQGRTRYAIHQGPERRARHRAAHAAAALRGREQGPHHAQPV